MDKLLDVQLSRRTAVRAGLIGAGSLIVACKTLKKPGGSAFLGDENPMEEAAAGSPFSGYLEIAADDKITFNTTRSEMGQGIVAGFAALLGEELDVSPEVIHVGFTGLHDKVKSIPENEAGGTGGSSSVRGYWQAVRKTGAAARDMLIAAAAAEWGVPAGECKVQDGKVVHPGSNKSAGFGSLAAKAAQQSVPQNPTLKDPSQFKYVGKALKRSDVRAKVDGSAVFGIDVKVEGMVNATIVHCPYVGGKLQSVNDTAAKAEKGVTHVVQTPYGVAVVADTFWHASNGAKKLEIQWQKTASPSSEQILTEQKQLVESPAMNAGSTGNFGQAYQGAAKKVEAYYQASYLAHVTMEPMNCTAHVKGDSVEIWVPTQDMDTAADVAAKVTGVDKANVKVHVTYLGGGFGRRLRQDYVAEACLIAKEVGKPVKVLWTRGEEFTHDLFRPSAYVKMQAGLDGSGKPVAWMNRIACSSIWSWLAEEPVNLIVPKKQTQVDKSAVEGAEKSPYGVSNFRAEWAQHEPGVPVFWWRSVGHSQNAFFTECFMDECAAAAGKDPYEYRMAHMTSARWKAVLKLAAEKAGWGTQLPAGKGRGIAIHESFGSVVAQVAEVTVDGGEIKVTRVVCAVDCGLAVNPALVHTQMESSVAQALGATLKHEITVKDGAVQQKNLQAYQPILMNEMPAVETHLVPSTGNPGGIGEPGVPPLAPAVANAVFAATGKRLRKMPLKLEG